MSDLDRPSLGINDFPVKAFELTRRHFLGLAAGSAPVLGTLGLSNSALAQGANLQASHPYSVPPLGYPYDALEPYIDAQTMEIHHTRHHAAYVANLNQAVGKYHELGRWTPEELVKNLSAIPEPIREIVRNHGGGHVNHSFFWRILGKSGPRNPVGELAKAIDARFGSFSKFQEEFSRAAAGVFGSGWAWLVVDRSNQLSVVQTPNQDSPLTLGLEPILGIDVWEHAYYLKYKNRRSEYIAAFFNVIHWDAVSSAYADWLKRRA